MKPEKIRNTEQQGTRIDIPNCTDNIMEENRESSHYIPPTITIPITDPSKPPRKVAKGKPNIPVPKQTYNTHYYAKNKASFGMPLLYSKCCKTVSFLHYCSYCKAKDFRTITSL